MLRNEILWLRRRMLASSKFFSRLSHRNFVYLRTNSDIRRITSLVTVLLGFALIIFYLLQISVHSVNHQIFKSETELILKKLREEYEGHKEKFLTRLEKKANRVFKWHQNKLKNKLNAKRIVQILKKEWKYDESFEELPCAEIKPDCPLQPPNLRGSLPVKRWVALQRLRMIEEQKNYKYHHHSGTWSPPSCTSRHSVAVIVPYRNRIHQLHLLMQHLPNMLKKQQISYKIFVVEQVGNKTFNKGILMNAGFMTALTKPAHGVPFHCFIFHDADLMSEDDRNMYTCPEFPRHMSVAVDELFYELPYPELVGGVFVIKTEHFIEVNGYSNLYWGWGGEDDDMGLRVEKVLKWTLRPPPQVGRFMTIPHVKQTPFLSLNVRHHLLHTAKTRYRKDGLTSLNYKLDDIVEREQFTHVYVDVGDPPTDFRKLTKLEYSRRERISMQRMLKKLRRLRRLHQKALDELYTREDKIMFIEK